MPSDSKAAEGLVERMAGAIRAGLAVAVHCRAGIGRSAMIAAAVLVTLGAEESDAWARIQEARGCAVPDTARQREWADQFARARESNDG